MQFTLAICASQGARRAQEDCALSWPPAGAPDAAAPDVAAVLCDGMGGHAGGATASRLACETFLPEILSNLPPDQVQLLRAAEAANAAIAKRAEQSRAFSDMGTTLVGVHLGANGLSWVSVGDSLLYLVRGGELIGLNADHSLAPELDKLAASGKISWEAARNDPRRHYLRSALTGDEIDMVDVSPEPQPLQDQDVVLIASDGIHALEEAEIAAIVAACATKGPDAIAQRLIAAVDEAGIEHQDNTTVVAICVSGSGDV